MPLLLIAVAFVALAAIAIGSFATRIVNQDRAQAAADAAALAYLVGGRGDAERIASRNDAVLVSVQVDETPPRSVTVAVRVGDRVATARATDAP